MFKIFEQQIVRCVDGSPYDVTYDLRYKSRDERLALAEAKLLASNAIKHYGDNHTIEVFEMGEGRAGSYVACDVRIVENRNNVRFPVHSFFIEKVEDDDE